MEDLKTMTMMMLTASLGGGIFGYLTEQGIALSNAIFGTQLPAEAGTVIGGLVGGGLAVGLWASLERKEG